MPRCVCVVLAIGLLAPPATRLHAQTVYGRVVDSEARTAVSFAQLSLLAADGSVVSTMIADSTGSFRLPIKNAGSYRIRAERIGYTTSTSPVIEVNMRESMIVEVQLSAAGIPLDPLRITVRGLERGRDGFERRSQLGKGIFLSRDSINARKANTTSNLFQGIKGLSVRDTLLNNEYGTFHVPRIKSMIGWGCFAVFHNNQVEPVSFSSSPTNSGPRVGVMRDQRTRIAFGGQEVLNLLLTPDDINGVEIYRQFSDVPNELKKTLRGNAMWPEDQLGPCGIAIIWTRAGW